MEWKLARITTTLTADGNWEGLVLGQSGAPSLESFFRVGPPGGALVHAERYVSIRIGWYDAAGDPVAIKGTCTAEPVCLAALPRPDASGQTQHIMSVGDAVADIAAWYPWSMPVQPQGLWTVRLSAMAAVGATRAAVFYLARP